MDLWSIYKYLLSLDVCLFVHTYLLLHKKLEAKIGIFFGVHIYFEQVKGQH